MEEDYKQSLLCPNKQAKSNYGYFKRQFEVNPNKINWDYIKGIIDTDGCIGKTSKDSNRVVISQSFPKYILSLKGFIEKERNIAGKTYMNGTQLAFYNKQFKDFIIGYSINDYDSYYAGIIDGDGSICRKGNGSGKYYPRLTFGFSKQRKIDIIKKFISFYGVKYSSWIAYPKNRKPITYFSIDNEQDVFKILMKTKDKLIIKNTIAEMIICNINKKRLVTTPS